MYVNLRKDCCTHNANILCIVFVSQTQWAALGGAAASAHVRNMCKGIGVLASGNASKHDMLFMGHAITYMYTHSILAQTSLLVISKNHEKVWARFEIIRK